MSRLPDSLQDMKQIEYQGHLQFCGDPPLKSAFAVGHSDMRLVAIRITALNFLDHLINDGVLTLDQTGQTRLFSGRE